MSDQDQSLRILENALRRIVRYSPDCDYYDSTNRPSPCNCPSCVARTALDTAKSWRFHGANHDRASKPDTWPREAKMQAAWEKLLMSAGTGGPDHLLALVLKQEESPSARDWFVATSVVQWLATNVGMSVLEAAGFKYQQSDQDEAAAKMQRRLEREARP